MARLSILINDNANVENKANFFAVYFELFVSQAGRSVDFEIENPRSLTNKILFQLTNNLDKCWPTVESYLLHPFFTNDRIYLKTFLGFNELEPLIDELLSSKKPSSLLVEGVDKYILAFSTFKKALDEEMFNVSLKGIISYLDCIHDLDHHKEDIKARVKILVSEYFFRQRDRDYIMLTMGKILSRGIDEFPFPIDIKTEQEKKDFIENRTLQQQFNAIFTFLDRPSSPITFYYRIFGGGLDKEIELVFNHISFYSKEHEKLNSFREEHPNFFNVQGNFFIASVRVPFFSLQNAINEARQLIRKELNLLSIKLNRDFILDIESNYLVSDENWSDQAWTSEKRDDIYAVDALERRGNYAYEKLKEVNNAAVPHVFAHEHLFIKAVYEQDMAGYWHWLEALMQFKKRKGGFIETVAVITSLSEQSLRKGIVIEELSSAFSFMFYPRNKYKYTVQEAHEAVMQIMKGNIPAWVRGLNDSIVQHFVEYFDYKLTSQDFVKVSQYYQRILRDAYAQRNSYVHQGATNLASHIKLTYSLPSMIERFRFILFEAIKKNDYVSFDEVIDILYKEGLREQE